MLINSWLKSLNNNSKGFDFLVNLGAILLKNQLQTAIFQECWPQI